MHNNIDIDGILNNHKTRKRKTMYPKDWSDKEEVKPIEISEKTINGIKVQINNMLFIAYS